jgi:hypothetical protein
MVRAASRCFFLRTNLVVSIRLEELLVRGALSNPVRKNRRLIAVAESSEVASPRESRGCLGPNRTILRCKTMQKAHFAGRSGSVRMRSLVLRHFEQKTQAQIKSKQEEKWH